MALVPHKITALAESDAQGTNGSNIVAGAVVSLYDTNGTAVTLFDDAGGSNGSTTKQTDTTGQVVVWVTAGEYDEEVNGSVKRRVSIGSKELTTEQLIDSVRNYQAGDVITTTGFTSGGDGGSAQWKASSTTGLTPSQTPADRGAAELVDGNGRLWELVGDVIHVNMLKDSAGSWDDVIEAAIFSADANRATLDLGNNNISVTKDIIMPNTLNVVQGSRGALIGNNTNDVIISNSTSPNGKKKIFGTIANMDRGLVVRGSINNIEFHTISGCRQGLVIEALSSLSTDRSLDNVIYGVQIGVVEDGIVFQQYEDDTVQQGNEINVNFISGVKDAVVFDDNNSHTKAGDWDSNYINLQAIDNQRDNASFLLNRTSFVVNNQTIISNSWNGGLLSPNSNLVKGLFRGCNIELITATPTTADDVCSLADASALATCRLKIKRAFFKLGASSGELVAASSTQVAADFNGGLQVQVNRFLLDYTLPSSLPAGALARCFFFHPLAFSVDANPFSVQAFNMETMQKYELICQVTDSTNGDRGMVSVWIHNKTGAGINAGDNLKMIISADV